MLQLISSFSTRAGLKIIMQLIAFELRFIVRFGAIVVPPKIVARSRFKVIMLCNYFDQSDNKLSNETAWKKIRSKIDELDL